MCIYQIRNGTNGDILRNTQKILRQTSPFFLVAPERRPSIVKQKDLKFQQHSLNICFSCLGFSLNCKVEKDLLFVALFTSVIGAIILFLHCMVKSLVVLGLTAVAKTIHSGIGLYICTLL